MNNDTQIHRYAPSSKNGTYKIIVFLGIGLTCVLLVLGYIFFFKVQRPDQADVSRAQSSSKTVDSKVELPHTYQVVSMNERDIILGGQEGEMAIPNGGSGVMVFKGTPQTHTEASITDIKVGQSVVLEIIPGEKAWIYIL